MTPTKPEQETMSQKIKVTGQLFIVNITIHPHTDFAQYMTVSGTKHSAQKSKIWKNLKVLSKTSSNIHNRHARTY